MARRFAAASGQGLYVDAVPFAAPYYPYTVVAWFRDLSPGTIRTLVYLGDRHTEAETGHQWRLRTDGGGYLTVGCRADADTDETFAAVPYSTGVWHHGAAVVAGAASRTVYLDGGNAATGTVPVSPLGLDRLSIGYSGDLTPGVYWDGDLAEVALWAAALPAAALAALAAGFPPPLVRPVDLVFYAPLLGLGGSWLGDDDRDLVGGGELLAVGAPTNAPHPPGYGPRAPLVGLPRRGAGGAYAAVAAGRILAAGAAPAGLLSALVCWGAASRSWEAWRRADGSAARYDSPFGKLQVQPGETFYSDVVNLGAGEKGLRLVVDAYGAGSGAGALAWRGAPAPFAWNDPDPAWTPYAAPAVHDWQYVQVAVSA